MVIRQYIIYCEDTYGIEFYKKLYKRIKSELNKNITCNVNVLHIHGICSQKFTKQLKASLEINNNNVKIIIIADGDNKKEEIYDKIASHINKKYKDRVHVILFDYSIEEWICKSLGIKYSYSLKPDKALSEYIRRRQGAKKKYEKQELSNFVNKLDFEILLNNDKQFKTFYNLLSNC